MINKQIIEKFVAGDYPQIHCEKCENTFLTNVYEFDEAHVLLEKRSLGLEFYCGALGLKEISRRDVPAGRFTLIFLAAPASAGAFVMTSTDADMPLASATTQSP